MENRRERLVAVLIAALLLAFATKVFAAPVGIAEPDEQQQIENDDEKKSSQRVIDLNAFPMNGRGDIVQLWPEVELINNETMRNALKQSAENRWTEMRDPDDESKYMIPYVITGNYSKKELSVIHNAMRAIAKNSCIRFRPRTDEPDYVDIQNEPDEGCYTMVGRLPGRNVVMLETQKEVTCITHQAVTHELLHKCGLWHEMSRYDRDDALLVHYENIPVSLWPQFRRVGENESFVYGVKYDYESVMHYGKTAGSVSRAKLAMQTRDRTFQDRIGQSDDASDGDYRKLCSIYNCGECQGKPFRVDTKASDCHDSKRYHITPCSFPLVPVEKKEELECDNEDGWLNAKDNPYMYEITCCKMADEVEEWKSTKGKGKPTMTTTTQRPITTTSKKAKKKKPNHDEVIEAIKQRTGRDDVFDLKALAKIEAMLEESLSISAKNQ